MNVPWCGWGVGWQALQVVDCKPLEPATTAENPRVGGSIPPLATIKSAIWTHRATVNYGMKLQLWNIRGSGCLTS